MLTTDVNRTWPATVDGSGRVLIPAALRQAMQAGPGDALLWVKDDHGVHLKSFDDAIGEIQDYYQRLSPADDLWSDAIIKQRRDEAACE